MICGSCTRYSIMINRTVKPIEKKNIITSILAHLKGYFEVTDVSPCYLYKVSKTT